MWQICQKRQFIPLLIEEGDFLPQDVKEAAAYSNTVLDTHFTVLDDMQCEFYPNNKECKRLDCPFFPARTQELHRL